MATELIRNAPTTVIREIISSVMMSMSFMCRLRNMETPPPNSSKRCNGVLSRSVEAVPDGLPVMMNYSAAESSVPCTPGHTETP